MFHGDQALPAAIVLPRSEFLLPTGEGLLGEFITELPMEPLGHLVAFIHVVSEPIHLQHLKHSLYLVSRLLTRFARKKTPASRVR
ncbi:hypothetical protein D3C75_1199600 [compost metagenome]